MLENMGDTSKGSCFDVMLSLHFLLLSYQYTVRIGDVWYNLFSYIVETGICSSGSARCFVIVIVMRILPKHYCLRHSTNHSPGAFIRNRTVSTTYDVSDVTALWLTHCTSGDYRNCNTVSVESSKTTSVGVLGFSNN